MVDRFRPEIRASHGILANFPGQFCIVCDTSVSGRSGDESMTYEDHKHCIKSEHHQDLYAILVSRHGCNCGIDPGERHAALILGQGNQLYM